MFPYGCNDAIDDVNSGSGAEFVQEERKPLVGKLPLVAVHGLGNAVGTNHKQIAGLHGNRFLLKRKLFQHAQGDAADVQSFERTGG